MNLYTERVLWDQRVNNPLCRLVLLTLSLMASDTGHVALTLSDITSLTCVSRKRVRGALNALQYQNIVVSCDGGYQLYI